MLFLHELLNAYTNSYTTSETPFSAFCLTVRHSYQDAGDENSFCLDDTFVRVWFAFTQRQCLDSGMQCPTCGSSPDIVIADGVSLGTHVSKLTKSISPPTSVDERTIPQKDICTTVNKISDATVTHIPNILPDMSKIDAQYPELSSFICLYCSNGTNSPYYRTYRDLIQQIAAPDIVLQLIPVAAIEPLQQLREQGNPPNWLQSICPAFGAVINAHVNGQCPIPNDIRNIAGWLAARADDVYTRLAQHEPSPMLQPTSEPWEKIGICYGLPEIRK
ncbi:uncharacterized protein F5891DRAFT_1197280 [Suillus fuscotomentosus]|uniref:HMG domain-containing protein n=1 Tax=Suillus fuscotomentosus TaxID=1912939 RepID=A0AAD4HDM9_9AGAM|nr:uncharacterized protein F5891DRAFT_1197280 [Suillus fuscotomentosus]KAG1891838.1 hypothetical protein F5891DRAFT_1197280 [Suillus fuscotomentosus]